MDQQGDLKRLVAVARGLEPADVVLRDAQVLDVFSGVFRREDIALCGDKIAGTGQYPPGRHEVTLAGAYVTPGLIDAHVHVESSMVSPVEFARVVGLCGTTTVIADPHEIANVLGKKGLDYMLNMTEDLPTSLFFMLPSCVPAISGDVSGAVLTAQELANYLNHPRVLGLGEMMDFGGIFRDDAVVWDKLVLAQGRRMDGHAPGVRGLDLTGYIAAGAATDHECSTAEELTERVRQGVYVMLRQGSAARNLLDLLPAVTPANAWRCLLATDDRHPEDLLGAGHINELIRMAVDAGLAPETAVQMATVFPATCYDLRDRGAIAPGRRADLVVFSDLKTWKPQAVWSGGQLLTEASFVTPSPSVTRQGTDTVHLHWREEPLRAPAVSSTARVMGMVPGQLLTKSLELDLPVVDGAFQTDINRDIIKLAVWERHHATGQVGIGFLQGLGLRRGAVASTVAHDSHQLIVAGANDEDMLLAVRHLEKIQGGLVLVCEGEVLGDLPLPIAGLMSDCPMEEVQKQLVHLQQQVRSLGLREEHDPFMTLAFLSLPVIPELKLTVKGLFDVFSGEVLSLSV